MTTFHLLITPGAPGRAPTVLGRAVAEGGATIAFSDAIDDPASDAAMVARVMLQSGAYLFAQGQPVEFGAEIPRDVLK